MSHKAQLYAPFSTGYFRCWGIMSGFLVITPHLNTDARCVQTSAPLYFSGCPELDSGLLSRPVKNKLFVTLYCFPMTIEVRFKYQNVVNVIYKHTTM